MLAWLAGFCSKSRHRPGPETRWRVRRRCAKATPDLLQPLAGVGPACRRPAHRRWRPYGVVPRRQVQRAGSGGLGVLCGPGALQVRLLGWASGSRAATPPRRSPPLAAPRRPSLHAGLAPPVPQRRLLAPPVGAAQPHVGRRARGPRPVWCARVEAMLVRRRLQQSGSHRRGSRAGGPAAPAWTGPPAAPSTPALPRPARRRHVDGRPAARPGHPQHDRQRLRLPGAAAGYGWGPQGGCGGGGGWSWPGWLTHPAQLAPNQLSTQPRL